MVREIHGAKINPKSSFKNLGAQNTQGRKIREQIRYLNTVKMCQTYQDHLLIKQVTSKSSRYLFVTYMYCRPICV